MRVRTEARREHIIEIASQVFRERGFERASMNEIADRVGGSKATLYGYFPTKEALFLSVVHAEAQTHLDSATAQLKSHGEPDLRELLAHFGAAIVSFLCSDVAVAAHRMVIGAAGRSDIGRQFYEQGPRQGQKAMAEALQAAMQRGELRTSDPVVAAQHLAGLLNSEVQYRWFYQNPDPISKKRARQIAERAVDVFLRGYGV